MYDRKKKTLPGSVLPYMLVIMFVVSILLVSILSFVTSQIRNSSYSHSKEQAFQIAESGIHFYKWYLAHNTDGRTLSQIDTFWTSGSVYGVGSAYEFEYSDPSGGAVGRYRIEVTPPSQGSTIAIVRSTGWTYKYPDHTRTIQVRFRRPSWSESTVLANDFMRFGEGTEVYGQIHSNQGVRFDGLAHNLVTSSVSSFNDPDHSGNNEFGVHTHVNVPPSSGVNDTFRAAEAPPTNPVPTREDVFQAGREFPVTTTDFNGVLGDFSYMKSQAQSGVNGSRYFDTSNEGRRIILKTNGTFDICKVNAYDSTNVITSYRRNSGGGTCGTCSGSCLSNYTIPNNGVIFVEDNVWLSGQVTNKKVTIAAANLLGGAAPSVFIPNDIRYTAYNGNDIIGIMAQQDIEIPYNSEDNLRIDAALLAQQGRVGRDDYGTSDHKSVITVYGAMATNQRYGFAWTNGWQDWGYTTRNLYYDNNLLYYPPPYFPTGTQYFVDLWEEI